jgi:hypothetical protein
MTTDRDTNIQHRRTQQHQNNNNRNLFSSFRSLFALSCAQRAIEESIMRHAKAIVALLFAMLSASAVAGNEAPNVSDEQMTCAGAASQEYETASAALAQRATADGSMSIEDTIAQRRLAEDFCKRWATCLVSNITEPGLREIAMRASFAGCLSGEAKDTE